MFLHHFINNCNLAQLIDEPTREPSNTLLDVIMTNSPASVYAHGVLGPVSNDHKPVYACLNFEHRAVATVLGRGGGKNIIGVSHLQFKTILLGTYVYLYFPIFTEL